MIKGKTSVKENRYISVAVIPHSSGKVRVFKLTAIRSKLISLFLLLVTAVVCAVLLVSHTINENAELKNKVDKLYSANMEQNSLLAEKAGQIEAMKASEALVTAKSEDYVEKYREVMETYITGRTEGGVASRSGDRTEKDFATDIKELKGLLDDFTELNSLSSGEAVDLSEIEGKLRNYLDSIPTLWPATGRLSGTFGNRRDPITRKNAVHEGLDIANGYGTDIKAAASGKVTFSGVNNGYGRFLVIDHGNGLTTAYGHAQKLLVKEGQSVKKGEVIAKMGSSGKSTGSHLHFEVRLFGTPVDPLKYLDDK